MSDTVRKLQQWLTIAEAAHELSAARSEKISPAEVLRLVLDNHLRMSVYLPSSVDVTGYTLDTAGIAGSSRRMRLQGLFDVPMAGAARLQVEQQYHLLCNLPFVRVDGSVGAFVEHEGMLCQLPPQRGHSGMWPIASSAFPRDSTLVVRREALEAVISSLPAISDETPSPAPRPLKERERTTLLTIIAALATELGINLNQPSKAGEAIESMTTRLGARVSARTIEDHLKRIPDALEKRGKDST